MILDVIVKRQDMQNIQQLALIFMQALNLHIEDRIRVNVDAVVLRNIGGKAYLILALDGLQIFQNIRIVAVLEQRLECIRILQEAVADQLFEIRRQLRVRLAQPAPVGDAIGHVHEALRIHVVIVAEDRCLQDLGVELRDAVDHVAAGKAEVCHAHLAV